MALNVIGCIPWGRVLAHHFLTRGSGHLQTRLFSLVFLSQRDTVMILDLPQTGYGTAYVFLRHMFA